MVVIWGIGRMDSWQAHAEQAQSDSKHHSRYIGLDNWRIYSVIISYWHIRGKILIQSWKYNNFHNWGMYFTIFSQVGRKEGLN
jgi:hypothetical protein